MNYVDTIARVLADHRYYYDSFDQNIDCHQCVGSDGHDHCHINGRSRTEVERHIAEEIAKVVGVGPVRLSNVKAGNINISDVCTS